MKPRRRIRGTPPEVERRARHLRHRLTLAQVRLWQALYCPACRLIVAVDGAVHQQQQDYDDARTELLQGSGYAEWGAATGQKRSPPRIGGPGGPMQRWGHHSGLELRRSLCTGPPNPMGR